MPYAYFLFAKITQIIYISKLFAGKIAKNFCLLVLFERKKKTDYWFKVWGFGIFL